MVPDEISIWIHRLSKQFVLPNVDVHHPICWEPELNKKAKRRVQIFLPDGVIWDIYLLFPSSLLFSRLESLPLAPLVLKLSTRTKLHCQLPWGSNLRLFSLCNCMIQFLIINFICTISYWFCLSGEPWLRQYLSIIIPSRLGNRWGNNLVIFIFSTHTVPKRMSLNECFIIVV